jgi:hypothetical protein
MKRPVKIALALVLLAVSVAGAIGCGNDEPTVATASMTKSAFVSKVDGICAHGRLRALHFEPSSVHESERDAVTAAIEGTLLPSIQEVIDSIYALGAPAGEEASTEALLVSMQGAVDEAEGRDTPTLAGVENLLAPSGRLACKAGLRSCIYG